MPPTQGTTKPWAQPLLQGTRFPHHQVPQLTPSPTPWPWGERGGCQELGLGCGRSCPAGRAGDGRESRAAFPARVGPSWPPSTPLCPLFPWGSTQQPQNVDPKSSFPSLWGLLAVARARIPLQEARSGSTGHSVSPTLLPAGGWGALGPSGRSGSAVRSHRLCTHRCHMTTGTQRDGWGWGGAVFAMRGDCRPGAAGQRPGWRPDSTASATVPPIGALVGHPAVPTAQLGHGYRWAAGEMKQKANKVGAGLHPNPMARVIW